MMVDLGGGARERLQNASAEVSEEALPPISSVGYAHPASRPTSWRSTFQEQDTPDSLNLVESVPHNLIQVKSDPESLSGLCIGNSSSLSETPVSCTEAAEDARAKGQLLQEITHVAETFEPYSSSLPPGCYRNYTLSSDAPAHTDYIFADTPHWCWSRSSTDDKTLSGHNGGSLFTGTVPSNETVINSLQYNVPPHLMSDAFSSPLPPVSVNQSPTSVPTCSPIQKPPPPPPLSALTSSALDLSPGPPPTTHQLPSLQPSLLTPASTHMTTLGSAPPSTHQLPNLPPSLISLEIPSQALSAQDTLDNTLDLVGVEESASHERVPEFECGECGAVFSRLPHLKYHMKIHGEVEKSSDKQDFTADSSNSKFRVQSSEKVFPCKHCGEKFSRAEKLKTHEVKHSGNRPFRCNDCGAAFPAKAMLIRHKKVHTGEKPYKCDICKTCFTEAGSLKVHKRLHSGEKPFKCDQCDVAFNGAGMLATHKRKHTGERPYMCDECGETFRLLSTLKSHRRRHTGEKPFVCELCGSSFTQRAAMQRHKRIHSDQKPWECGQCGYKFREKENLRKHVALHKIKLQHMCDICGAGFNQAKKLETHKMLHNGGDRPYKCNKCPSTFTNPKYLTQHKKRVHDRKGAIRCEECNGTFKRKETLRSHMRIHKGERPYVCEECGAAFNQRGTLTKHIRVHGNQALINNQDKNIETKSFDHDQADANDQTPCGEKEDGEAEFNCSVCSLHFPSQRELMQHSRSSHPKSLQENTASDQDVDDSSEHIRDKYICEDCNQTFFRKRQLKAHKKYCPCRCPSYQVDLPEKAEVTTMVQSDTREVDAMKLLTAVLAATTNSTGEVSDFHSSSSSNENPPSVPTISLHSSSSSTITSNVEEHHDRHESLRLFSACDPSYAEHLHIDFKDSHLDHSPQHPSHLPQSPQPPDRILHQPSQDHSQLDHSHLSLEHMSQDHVQHSSHMQSSGHHSSHILLSQSFEQIHHSSQQSAHLHQQPPQPEAHIHNPLQDHTEQDHSHLIPRQYTHLQHPLKEHSQLSPPPRHQDSPHQAARIQIISLREAEVPQSSHDTNPVQHLQLKQIHAQPQPDDHQIDLIVQGQFFKTSTSSSPLSSQHLHHHHLPNSENSNQSVHLQEHPSHIISDIKDRDELDHSLQHHHGQEETENCHCHYNHHHSQQLPQHFKENEEQSESDSNLHHHHCHHHHHHRHRHHHHQGQQNPFCPTLECPIDIKIEDIM